MNKTKKIIIALVVLNVLIALTWKVSLNPPDMLDFFGVVLLAHIFGLAAAYYKYFVKQ